MIGFLPGFPYLGVLDSRLRLPRRDVPRAVVPRGSVAIAGPQTGIYPTDSPGGWHVIGRTPAPLFDASATPPGRLSPGDRVRFVPVPASRFESLAGVTGEATR
jgi:KipI family sensor histidine kinase inhibitor